MNRIYLNELFDYYKLLLTPKEVNIFIDYYEEDLSLQEIANNLNISKSAVGKTLKTVENKLLNYEEKLQLKKKNRQINELLYQKVDSNLLEKINEII